MTGCRHIRSACRLANPHNNIDWTKLIPQQAEYLSHRAFHQGTRNRARGCMPADYYSQAGLFTRRASSAQNEKEFALSSRCKHTGELRPAAQPRLARQAGARRF
jgi:hypothetical protein